ncbi:unnamed protein product, partial [marine sediment metagenome]
ILLNLSDSSGVLAQKLGGSVRNIEDLIPALIQLRSEGVDLNTTLQLTDKRSVAAFNSLLEGAADVLVLRDSLVGANDELEEMVTTKTDNAIDAMARMGSAWDGVVLKFKNSEGVFADLFDFIADGLNITSDRFATFGEKAIGLLGGIFPGIGTLQQKAIIAAADARQTVLDNIRKSGLEELGETRRNFAAQARAGDEFAKEVIKRVDSQLIAITEANRKAADRDKQSIIDAQAAIDNEKNNAREKELKEIEAFNKKKDAINERSADNELNILRKLSEQKGDDFDLEIEAEINAELELAQKRL